LQYLNEALALDPSHAAAWAELSRAYANCGGYGWMPVVEAYRKAREAALRSLQLAPGMAEGHVRLSAIQRTHDWDWKGAEESIRKAVQLAPGSAEVLRSAGTLAHMLGRFDEAESLIRRSIEQDPLNAGGYTALAQVYRALDRLSDAEKAYRKTLELSRSGSGPTWCWRSSPRRRGPDSDALAAAGLGAARNGRG
jgi:tetratricopeptide (TPR) repeat protein